MLDANRGRWGVRLRPPVHLILWALVLIFQWLHFTLATKLRFIYLLRAFTLHASVRARVPSTRRALLRWVCSKNARRRRRRPPSRVEPR